MTNVSSSNGIGKYPKLRFPEFTEPWSHIKLSDFAERIMRKNKNNETDLPLTISSKDGLVDQISFFNKTVASKDMSGYYLLMNGEYAYNKSYSVGYDFGSIKRLDRYPMGALSTLYICFALRKYNSDFIKTYFDSLKWYKEIYMISAEGARNHGLLNVPTDEFFDTYHYLTENEVEQTKIATLMELIEERIQKQQALVDNLKKYKRGVEKLLFDGYRLNNGCATRIKLGDACEFFSGGTPSSGNRNYYGGNIPFIRSGEIHSEQTELFLTESGLKSSAAKKVEKGDLLLALYGATSGEVDISRIEGAINQAILCIRPYSLNKVYLKHLLSYNKTNIINTYLQGGQGNLSAEIIKGLSFDIPNAETQNKIAEILDTVDKRIYYAEKTKQALELFKKGMLHRLFI